MSRAYADTMRALTEAYGEERADQIARQLLENDEALLWQRIERELDKAVEDMREWLERGFPGERWEAGTHVDVLQVLEDVGRAIWDADLFAINAPLFVTAAVRVGVGPHMSEVEERLADDLNQRNSLGETSVLSGFAEDILTKMIDERLARIR